MRRFFCDSISDSIATILGDEHKHLSVVLRLKVGDSVIVGMGDGLDYHGVISSISKTQTLVEIQSSTQNLCEPKHKATLFLALPKADKLELIVQKSVELGISRLVPFVSKNCTATSLNPSRAIRIATEACKQCGRSGILPIDEVQTFTQILSRLGEYDKILFAYENGQTSVRSVLEGYYVGASIAIIVGSEGGFLQSEAQKLIECGADAVTLGNRILRCETAAIALAALVAYRLGGMEL